MCGQFTFLSQLVPPIFPQDQWYDVRGPDFIIQRAESGLGIEAECVQRLPRKPRHVAPAVKPSTMGLVHRAMRQNPASFMLLEGGVIEVSDFLDACDDAEQEHAASVAPNTSCTGIVRVADSQEQVGIVSGGAVCVDS